MSAQHPPSSPQIPRGTGVPAVCAGCGRCCVRDDPELDVYVDGGDPVPLAMTEVRDGARWMRRRPDQACIALDPLSRRCTIYELRPLGCRDFEHGSAECAKVCARPLPILPAVPTAPT